MINRPRAIILAVSAGRVLIISPQGKVLGPVLTGKATANVAFGGKDGKTVIFDSS